MEENKVATKLKQIVHDSYWGTDGETCLGHSLGACNLITDAILQSPDLRVTLVEPRYFAESVYVRDRGTISNYAFASFATETLAQEYADFKNSKEQK